MARYYTSYQDIAERSCYGVKMPVTLEACFVRDVGAQRYLSGSAALRCLGRHAAKLCLFGDFDRLDLTQNVGVPRGTMGAMGGNQVTWH